ncbi:hypothetical protein JST97_09575 [bacterium]|nr:hypothetical protein [bacterium]
MSISATATRPSGFNLPSSAIRQWEAERAPSPHTHIDSFEGSRLHPLTNADSYPGLRNIANQTTMQKLDPTRGGDPLLGGILISGPILGIAGASLLMLAKDGAFKANLISQGEIKELPTKVSDTYGYTCDIQMPDGGSLGFRRGLHGSASLGIWSQKGETKLEASYFDIHQQQPRLNAILVSSEREELGQKTTQLLTLKYIDNQLPSVKIVQHRELVGEPDSALTQELNNSMSLATTEGGYVSPPTHQEMYQVAHGLMGKLDSYLSVR